MRRCVRPAVHILIIGTRWEHEMPLCGPDHDLMIEKLKARGICEEAQRTGAHDTVNKIWDELMKMVRGWVHLSISSGKNLSDRSWHLKDSSWTPFNPEPERRRSTNHGGKGAIQSLLNTDAIGEPASDTLNAGLTPGPPRNSVYQLRQPAYYGGLPSG